MHRMMKKRCLETAAESSAAASKGSTGLCGNNLSVRGSKGEGAGGEKCTGRKRADAIQIELKNRQNTNHLFELLKKTRDQLEILKGQETKAEEMRKQIHAAIRAEKAAAAEEQLQKTKGECANLKKESRELEEKLKQQAKDLESAGAL